MPLDGQAARQRERGDVTSARQAPAARLVRSALLLTLVVAAMLQSTAAAGIYAAGKGPAALPANLPYTAGL